MGHFNAGPGNCGHLTAGVLVVFLSFAFAEQSLAGYPLRRFVSSPLGKSFLLKSIKVTSDLKGNGAYHEIFLPNFHRSSRSVLTKMPPWVKWSMQKNMAASGRTADLGSQYEQSYDRNTREVEGFLPSNYQLVLEDGPPSSVVNRVSGPKTTNVACFFNPVSCFGRRASRRSM